jgi:hypothetical protein
VALLPPSLPTHSWIQYFFCLVLGYKPFLEK